MKEKLIIIGIATFQRPKMLSDVIRSLSALVPPENYKVEILIVDNDKESNGYELSKSLSAEVAYRLHYVVERERGIVNARNTILKVAYDLNAEYLAFVDDDETVSPTWLINLLSAREEYQAVAVEGKVIYQLPDNCPKWIRDGGFFGKESKPTGSKIKYACTNNVLIDLKYTDKQKLIFNNSFNKSGGSDTHFFDELRRSGGKIVWCEEAITYEIVPATRANKKWILKRAFKSGATAHIRNQVRFGKVLGSTMSLMYILFFLFRWLVSVLMMKFLTRAGRVHLQRELRMARGSIHMMMGRHFEAYEVIHGS